MLSIFQVLWAKLETGEQILYFLSTFGAFRVILFTYFLSTFGAFRVCSML
jgi:hypothetical protein